MKLGSRTSHFFGSTINLWFLIFTAVQFHPLFWGSRLLPNIFALIFTNVGFCYWIEGLVFTLGKNGEEHRQRQFFMIKFLSCMIPASLIFRSEVAFLTGFILLFDFMFSFSFYLSPRRVSRVFRAVVMLVVFSLFSTIVVDSYFWKGSLYASKHGLLWPEGAVFYFNAILGKSQEWGVLPFHTYFTVFLPKVLGLAYAFGLLGFVYSIASFIYQTFNSSNEDALDTDDLITSCFNLVHKRLMFPSLLYVAFMSCLGHKEWRFLVYILPIFNLSAAVTVAKLIRAIKPDYNIAKKIFQAILTGLMCLSLMATFLLAFLSSLNYPGGEALKAVHDIAKNRGDSAPSVHIHVSAAMSGASRFGEIGQGWNYDKNETISLSDITKYDYLITYPGLQFNLSSIDWELVAEVYGLENVSRLALKPWAGRLLCTMVRGLGIPVKYNNCISTETKHQYIQSTAKSYLTLIRLDVITYVESILPVRVNFIPKQLIFRKQTK